MFIFDGNGATGGNAPDPELWMDPDGWAAIPDNTNNLTRIGHTFKGWAGNKNATTPDFATPGTPYTIGTIPNIFPINAILSVTEDWEDNGWMLYAVWEPLPLVTLTYNANNATGGYAPTDSNSPYQNGATVTVQGPGSLTKTNNIFLGWATTNNASLAQYTQDSKFIITTNTTLYAVWGSPSTPLYTITYNANGATSGNIPVDSNSYSQGVLATVKANTNGLTKIGHKFLGWHTNSSATTPVFEVTGTTVTPQSFNIQTSNIIFYAVWQPIQYCTITYNENWATSGSAPVDPNSPYEKGSTVTILDRGTLARLNYHFMGWTDLSSPNVTHYIETEFIITENIVLYASWEAIPPINNGYQVLYNKNGPSDGSVPYDLNMYQAGNTVFVKSNEGGLSRPGYAFLGWSPISVATKPTYAVSGSIVTPSKFYIGHNSVILYAIWEYVGNGSSGGGSGDGGGATGANTVNVPTMINVPYDGRYAGNNGSKGTILNYTGIGNEAMLKIASNLPSNVGKSAIIENLIIDGKNKPNLTGILLENVCNGLIRNLTIKNCTVGIRVKLTDGVDHCSQGNRFEHIRMINVKTGILFEGTNSTKDFSHTTIDDVGISLAGNSTDTGIKIGAGNNAPANMYCAFIKANVWLDSSKGTGLEVNGKLGLSLVNLAVEQSTGHNGCGVRINSNATVTDNQSFLLTALSLLTQNKIENNNNSSNNDIVINP